MTAPLSALPDRFPSLPGMERPAFTGGMMVEAAQAQVDALREAGRIGAGERLLVASILSLARSADMSMGKIAGVQAQKLLLEALDKLPPLEPESGDTAWLQVVEALSPPADPAE